jgi:hypothetical protein
LEISEAIGLAGHQNQKVGVTKLSGFAHRPSPDPLSPQGVLRKTFFVYLNA